MPSWERLQEAPPEEPINEDLGTDVLLSSDTVTTRPAIPAWRNPSQWECASKKNRYLIGVIIITTIMFVTVSTLVTIFANGNSSTTFQSKYPQVESTTPFLEPVEFDNNENALTPIRSISPPEYSPMLDFLYDYLSLMSSDGNSSSSSSTNVTHSNSDSVEVTIIYESLSIPTRLFFAHQLFPIYFANEQQLKRNPSTSQKKLLIKFVPYGHTKMSKTGKHKQDFTCEHGYDECEGNIVMACAIRHTRWNDSSSVHSLMKYIQCFMADTGNGNAIINPDADRVGMSCSKSQHVNWEPIYHCTQNSEGVIILRTFMQKTDKVLSTGTNKQTIYPLPVVMLKGYGILTETEKRNFSTFIQERLNK